MKTKSFSLRERYGRLDVLVNNAGMHQGALIEDIPTERFELMTKILLVVPFMATKLAPNRNES
ncbi:SDR family NAD(P)-dependent oxidoreductase [Sporosarcina siberiensis]|uniref:SDR family NAD(P)-dependent oxidoreductase n=1 Tax=Sporosarcina siberiensis TaxID=1365606 RepID=A0ABW4SG82_9BACL